VKTSLEIRPWTVPNAGQTTPKYPKDKDPKDQAKDQARDQAGPPIKLPA